MSGLRNSQPSSSGSASDSDSLSIPGATPGATPGAAPVEERAPFGTMYTRYVLGMVLLTSVLNNIDRTILSILVRPVKEEFQLTDTQMGWLLGPAFAIVYTVLSLPIGRYADTSGIRRTIVAVSLFVWSCFTAGTAFVSTYWQLFIMRMGVGVGESGGTAPSASMLSDYLPPSRRARGISVISIGSVMGMGLGMIVGGYISEAFGWRGAFLAAGVPGMLLALLYLLTVREPARGASEGREAASGDAFWATLKILLAQRTFLFILAANGFALFAAMGRNLWEPSFLVRSYGMGEFHAGTWYFLTSPLPSMLGIFLGGYLADRYGSRDARWYFWVPAIGQAISVPILVAFLLWPESARIMLPGFLAGTAFEAIPVALVWSIVGSVFGSFFTAPFMSTIQGVAPLRMRAFAMAISTLISTLVGLAAGPLLVGVLADGFTARFGDDALRYSLLVPTTAPLLSSLVCFIGARRVAGDLDRARSSDR